MLCALHTSGCLIRTYILLYVYNLVKSSRRTWRTYKKRSIRQGPMRPTWIFFWVYTSKNLTPKGAWSTQAAWHVNESAKRFATHWAKHWPVTCNFYGNAAPSLTNYFAAMIYVFHSRLCILSFFFALISLTCWNNGPIFCALLTAITSEHLTLPHCVYHL